MVMSQASSQSHAVDVDQEAHQLGDGDRRMGVVELDRDLVGQVVERRRTAAGGGARGPAARRRRRSTPAAAAAPGRPASRRWDRARARCASAATRSASAPTWSPRLKASSADRIARRAPTRAAACSRAAAPADDRRVVGDGERPSPPAARRGAACRPGAVDRLDRAAEADRRRRLRGRSNSHGLPTDEPVLRAVRAASRPGSPGGTGRGRSGCRSHRPAMSTRRHALHEAGGEAAEAAIAERGVGLELAQSVEVDAELDQRLAHGRRSGRDW